MEHTVVIIVLWLYRTKTAFIYLNMKPDYVWINENINTMTKSIHSVADNFSLYWNLANFLDMIETL